MNVPLFERVLGAAFARLPPRLQALHSIAQRQRWCGRGEVLRGTVVVETVRDPAKAAALAQTGLKQVMAGDTRGAIASFTAALRADRSHAPAQRGLGLAYEKRGDKARAVIQSYGYSF